MPTENQGSVHRGPQRNNILAGSRIRNRNWTGGKSNARTWKQPRCPSADEWIRKQWYIYTMEYHSAIKKNTFESVLMRWMKLEPIIQKDRKSVV